MYANFPKNIKELLNTAINNLWDERVPQPDLSSMSDWLESDGWDDVVSGLTSSCIYTSRILEDFNDENLLEHRDIGNKQNITNDDRIAFARGLIDYLLSDSMDSCHSIPIETDQMPPAVLCFIMYFHPQGGASFYDLRVCHSAEDYLRDCGGEIINDSADLSNSEILGLWRKSEAHLKSWSKALL